MLQSSSLAVDFVTLPLINKFPGIRACLSHLFVMSTPTPITSLLAAVTAADNAPGPYAHPDATSHPKTWTEDHEDLYPFHLTREDHDRGDVVPIGWIRPQVADLLLNHWPEEDLGEKPSLEVQLDCVHFADWVLEDGTKGMDREMARLSRYWKDNEYFAECLDGK